MRVPFLHLHLSLFVTTQASTLSTSGNLSRDVCGPRTATGGGTLRFRFPSGTLHSEVLTNTEPKLNFQRPAAQQKVSPCWPLWVAWERINDLALPTLIPSPPPTWHSSNMAALFINTYSSSTNTEAYLSALLYSLPEPMDAVELALPLISFWDPKQSTSWQDPGDQTGKLES